MSGDRTHRHVHIDQDGRVLASAEITGADLSASIKVVDAALHIEPGVLPAGTRGRLIDAVLELPDTRAGDKLEATAPAGDGELLEQVRDRLAGVHTRTAGTTVLIDADLPRTPTRGHSAPG